ncbi:MAG: hypothetical protein LBT40_01705 [Deltaproteobacteria bacterium]|nr:hypothetical protein [Deltaproteobacteria bacterium]
MRTAPARPAPEDPASDASESRPEEKLLPASRGALRKLRPGAGSRLQVGEGSESVTVRGRAARVASGSDTGKAPKASPSGAGQPGCLLTGSGEGSENVTVRGRAARVAS